MVRNGAIDISTEVETPDIPDTEKLQVNGSQNAWLAAIIILAVGLLISVFGNIIQYHCRRKSSSSNPMAVLPSGDSDRDLTQMDRCSTGRYKPSLPDESGLPTLEEPHETDHDRTLQPDGEPSGSAAATDRPFIAQATDHNKPMNLDETETA